MMYLTCRGRTDGIGAQACGIISVFVVAMAFNIPFVYSPMIHIAHYPYPNPSQTEKRLWKYVWETLLGFQSFTDCIKPETHLVEINKTSSVFNVIDNRLSHNLTPQHANTTYCLREAHTVLSKYQQHPMIATAWEYTIEQLQQHYNRDTNVAPHHIDGYTNISVHIRRGDAKNSSRRCVDDSYYINVLNDITDKLQHNDIPYLVHIYSEGDMSEFKQFTELSYSDNIYFHLNDDMFDTLHHFVCADIFIMSKSTFSYLGALLNKDGIIIYNPFWLLPPKPLEHKWIIPNTID